MRVRRRLPIPAGRAVRARRGGPGTLLLSLALLLAGGQAGCKSDARERREESSTKVHLGGKRMTGLLQRVKARMGLYKAVGLQYCDASVNQYEYHVKELEDHSPLTAPLWGIVCLEKGFERATLRDGQEQLLATARKRAGESNSSYEIVSSTADLCGVDGAGQSVLTRVTSYEKGLWQSITDWRHRDLLDVCSTANGRELLPLAELQRDVVSPALFNENWKVVATDENDNVEDLLAKIWTNPAWGSWAVEDLQEKAKQVVKPAALYLLPVIQELRRRQLPPPTPSPDGMVPQGAGQGAPPGSF